MFDIDVQRGFSALQRAEIAEILIRSCDPSARFRFSALQRAEIAEIRWSAARRRDVRPVSVLFNEPKLLKCIVRVVERPQDQEFQCSSTSRNC